MKAEESASQNPKPVQVSLQPVNAGGTIASSITVEVIPADAVETEQSSTLKFLRLRNADYTSYTSVFLVVDGVRHEITMDTLPEEPGDD